MSISADRRRRDLLALRRDDVADLNGRARALMATTGQLGADQIDVAGRRFAVGDHVVCLSNARRFGVLNGTRGIVAARHPEARGLDSLIWAGRPLSARSMPLRVHVYARRSLPALRQTSGLLGRRA